MHSIKEVFKSIFDLLAFCCGTETKRQLIVSMNEKFAVLVAIGPYIGIVWHFVESLRGSTLTFLPKQQHVLRVVGNVHF